MDINDYLTRLTYNGPIDPNLNTLIQLHKAHLQKVPFENLSVHMGESINLEIPWLFNKIVTRERGGFCYECNGLFAWLLESLGFQVSLHSACVMKDGNGCGPEFDHLVLLVNLGEPWLADVGFGDGFQQPLQLREHGPQHQSDGGFKLRGDGSDYIYERLVGVRWVPQYRFSLKPRKLTDFIPMCKYHQTSPASSFTQKRVVTRLSGGDRITLTPDKLITTSSEKRLEQIIPPGTYEALLSEHFGIKLGNPGGG